MSGPSTQLYNLDHIDTGKLRIAICVADFNAEITHALRNRAIDGLREHEVLESHIEILHVPGAVELPYAAQLCIRKKKADAVICIGAVIKGETAHFDYVCQSVTQGLQDVTLTEARPVIFGVLTTNTEAEAIARTKPPFDIGYNCAKTAIYMAGLK